MPQSRRKIPTGRKTRRTPKAYEVIPVLVFMLLVFVLGYILIVGLLSGTSESPAYKYAMQTKQALESMPTPTPFQPVRANEEPVNDRTSSQGNTTTTRTPTTRPLQKPEGQVNILLLGSDVRPNDGGFRTDVIVWVSLNPKGEFVSAVSFPRDLYVQIPGQGENRINVAFPRGGFKLLADTFETNFGIRPDHYVMIDFNGFTRVINNLGGIDVQAAKNLTDSCAKWINPSGQCSVGPGLIHMDGDMALWYARSRYSTNDIDRARRAQEVIEAIFDRLMSFDIISYVPDLYDSYVKYVDTDITLGKVLPLLPLATKIQDNGDIRNYVVGFDHVYSWVTLQGAQVLVPDNQAIQELLMEALDLEY